MLVLLDLRKASNPASGLGQFCLQVSKALLEEDPPCSFHFLVENFQQSDFLPLRKMDRCILSADLANQYDLIHLTHQESSIPSFVKGKRVMTIHDLNFFYRYGFFKRMVKKIRLFNRLKACSRYSCVSKFTATEIQRIMHVLPENIRVIYNGVRCEAPPVKPNISCTDPYLLYIGNIHPRKNLGVLLNMMQYSGHKLILIGPGTAKHKRMFSDMCKQKGVGDKVIFAGTLNEPEKNYLLMHCDALVNPSLYEGFGLPVMEAFSFGKPVFCFAATALSEIGDKYAYYWNFDKPEQMAEWTEVCLSGETEMLSSKRVEYAKKFTWKKAAQDYLKWYYL